ncbi:MAG TPA: bacteriocin [Mariniphaga anaerophila]|uniref:Bacteriocin n=1 Tax=Mariniphaga anaerophila TaxID=1484053 RepID=A0A831PMZ7_9BACT|nr:bacteriocin [Mariniphaga anaerophila]
METKCVKNLQENELKKINGGGKIADSLGKALHYMIDHFYKAALIESTYSHNGSY